MTSYCVIELEIDLEIRFINGSKITLKGFDRPDSFVDLSSIFAVKLWCRYQSHLENRQITWQEKKDWKI